MIIFNSVYHYCSIYNYLKLLLLSRIINPDIVKILHQQQIWYNNALSENVRSLLYDVTQASPRASFLTPIFVDRLSFWGNASCLYVLIVCISTCSHVSYEWRSIKFLRGTRLRWEATREKEAHRWRVAPRMAVKIPIKRQILNEWILKRLILSKEWSE